MLRFESEEAYQEFKRNRSIKQVSAVVKKQRSPSEEQLQVAVVQYLDMVSRGRFRVVHIPNGAHMTVALGARRKRMGARAGAPDLILEVAGGGVIEIEMKTDSGRLSQSQIEWQKKSFEMGIPYFVCRSIEDVQAILKGSNLL